MPRFYSDASPFNQIVTGFALEPEPRQTACINFMQTLFSQTGNENKILCDAFSVPCYFADAITPRYDVTLVRQYSGKTTLYSVPIPAGASGASGSDAHMAVIDTHNGCEYDFFETNVSGATKQAGQAIAIQYATSDGVYPFGQSCRGSGFALMGGVMTKAELDAGLIDHALIISGHNDFVQGGDSAGHYGESDWVVTPATESDGQSDRRTWPGCIPEGARLRLKSSLNLNGNDPNTGQPFRSWEKTIGAAMRDYGLILADRGGTGNAPFSIYSVDPKSNASTTYPWTAEFTNNYPPWPRSFLQNLELLALPPLVHITKSIVENGCNLYSAPPPTDIPGSRRVRSRSCR